jgi:predicted RNA binding protein YcfA (HicA-like mRNA interferase family)
VFGAFYFTFSVNIMGSILYQAASDPIVCIMTMLGFAAINKKGSGAALPHQKSIRVMLN